MVYNVVVYVVCKRMNVSIPSWSLSGEERKDSKKNFLPPLLYHRTYLIHGLMEVIVILTSGHVRGATGVVQWDTYTCIVCEEVEG